jgi:HTH-type transcriptional regulator / antitoxin HigA
VKINFETIVKKVGFIETDREYRTALALADKLMEAKSGSQEEALLNVISILIDKYEEEHYPIPHPDPIEAIKFRLEQLGLTTKDLAAYVGGKNRVSEIMNRKRRLTVKMMKSLHSDLGVPAESLLNV